MVTVTTGTAITVTPAIPASRLVSPISKALSTAAVLDAVFVRATAVMVEEGLGADSGIQAFAADVDTNLGPPISHPLATP